MFNEHGRSILGDRINTDLIKFVAAVFDVSDRARIALPMADNVRRRSVFPDPALNSIGVLTRCTLGGRRIADLGGGACVTVLPAVSDLASAVRPHL
jgi:hypothetical protein